MRQVPYVDLAAQWQHEKNRLLPIIEKVLASGRYILGHDVEVFEKSIADLVGTRHCVAVNSGTDALMIALAAVGVRAGDEVVTPPNSFVASTAAIVHLGARPAFVDVLPDQNMDPAAIEAAITPRTRAIMPVHLTGRVCRMDQISAVADGHGIPIVEDAAQSIGSRYLGRSSGSWGAVGCFSAHPLKNLPAIGDGGYLTTDSDEIAEFARLYRNHGLVDRTKVLRFGTVSRMDSLKAAVLNFRLALLDDVIRARRATAETYREQLLDVPLVLPTDLSGEFNSYHTFVIQSARRDELREFMRGRGVGTSIHYPTPIHLQPASAFLGYGRGSFPVTEMQSESILSLPIHQHLDDADVAHVIECINAFFS